MAELPVLPAENEDPWYDKRQAFDLAVKKAVETDLPAATTQAKTDAITSANTYTDTVAADGDTDTLTAAKLYSDNTLTSAKTYSDDQALQALYSPDKITDLNTLTLPGKYFITGASANIPIGEAGHLEVIARAAGHTYIMQRYTTYNTYVVYVRILPGGSAWSPWTRMPSEPYTKQMISDSKASTMMTGEADLDLWVTPGTYFQEYLSQGTLARHYPIEPFAGLIEVKNVGSTSILQTATYYRADTPSWGVWKRTRQGTTWTAWKHDPLGDPTVIAAGTDLNNLTTSGLYFQTSAGGANAGTLALHYPMDNFAGSIEVSVTYSMGRQRATYYDWNLKRLQWERTWFTGSGWSPWIQVGLPGVPGGSDLSGHGSPLGVVTPSAKSVYYTDLDQTNGATRWVSTGTTTASWIVVTGDTGARRIDAASFLNGWSSSSSIIQRSGNLVMLALYGMVSTSATANILYILPSGFRNTKTVLTALFSNSPVLSSGNLSVNIRSDGTIDTTMRSATASYMNIAFMTNDPWPTTLPGTPA